MKLFFITLLLLPLAAYAGNQPTDSAPTDVKQTRHTQQTLHHRLNQLQQQLGRRNNTLKQQQALIKRLEKALNKQQASPTNKNLSTPNRHK